MSRVLWDRGRSLERAQNLEQCRRDVAESKTKAGLDQRWGWRGEAEGTGNPQEGLSEPLLPSWLLPKGLLVAAFRPQGKVLKAAHTLVYLSAPKRYHSSNPAWPWALDQPHLCLPVSSPYSPTPPPTKMTYFKICLVEQDSSQGLTALPVVPPAPTPKFLSHKLSFICLDCELGVCCGGKMYPWASQVAQQ